MELKVSYLLNELQVHQILFQMMTWHHVIRKVYYDQRKRRTFFNSFFTLNIGCEMVIFRNKNLVA